MNWALSTYGIPIRGVSSAEELGFKSHVYRRLTNRRSYYFSGSLEKKRDAELQGRLVELLCCKEIISQNIIGMDIFSIYSSILNRYPFLMNCFRTTGN